MKKPQKRDREQTSLKLLEAGLCVFAQSGYHGATTKQIAARAKVNEGLIARYYKGKEGLLIAILKEGIAKLEAMSLPYPERDSVERELTDYVRHRLKRSLEHSQFMRIVISQALSDAKFLKRVRTEVPWHPDPRLLERLCQLRKKGKIKAQVDLEKLVKVIESQVFGIIIHAYIMLGTPEEECVALLEKAASVWAQALKTDS